MNKNILHIILLLLVSAPLWAGTSTFPGPTLEQACLNYIRSSVPDAEVEITRNIEDIVFDYDGVTAECKGNLEALRGNCFVILEFSRGGQKLRRIEVPVLVRIFRNVATAKDNIRRGDILDEDDLLIQSKEVTHFRNDELPSVKQLVGSKARRNIGRNSVILDAFVEEEPLITRGDKVLIVASAGPISIRAEGTAMQDAGAGDIVRVKREESGAILEGRVDRDGIVYVNK